MDNVINVTKSLDSNTVATGELHANGFFNPKKIDLLNVIIHNIISCLF
jgi:hypothetical protein